MIIIAVVTYVYPWQEIVSGHVRTEVAFERTFGSHAIAQLILFGAFLSLLKIFNGNFVAATRMLYAIGRRNLVHPSLGRVHATHGTPVVAIALMAVLTAAAAMFGDAILVPITEVGSLAVGVGWLSACAAYLARRQPRPLRRRIGGDGLDRLRRQRRDRPDEGVPGVPGSFTRAGVDRVRRVVGASGWCSGSRGGRAEYESLSVCERLLRRIVLRQAAAESRVSLVDDGLRHAVDAVAAREIGKLGRFHREGGDVRVRERHFVREADRPRTVRSSRCREHLDRHRLVDRGDARAILRGEARAARRRRAARAWTSEMNS